MSAYQFADELKAHLDAVVVGEPFGNDTGDRIAEVTVDHQQRDQSQLRFKMVNGSIYFLTVH